MDIDDISHDINSEISKAVQEPEISIPENAATEEKSMTIMDSAEASVAGSMECVDSSHVTIESSPVLESQKDNIPEKNNVPCIEQTTEKETDPKLMQMESMPRIEQMTKDEEQTPEKITLPMDKVSSLSVIALAYDNSDSESEEAESTSTEQKSEATDSTKIVVSSTYRDKEETSDDESSSDESSSSESDSSSDNSSTNSESEKSGSKIAVRTKTKPRNANYQEKECKGEFDDLPPIEELKISVPEVLCDPLGEVAWMVEQMVVVRPKAGKPTLNLDTILFVERGQRVLGRIFDVFGQVSDPHYCVRFNSSEHIKESDIKVGMTVYFCPNTEYTSVVFVQDLLKMKATDEIGDDEAPEFSDDEEEQAYYAALKQKQKNDKGKSSDEIAQKRQRTDPGWKSNHPWSTGRNQEQGKRTENYKPNPRWYGPPRQNNPANLWQQYPHTYPNAPWQPEPNFQGNAWPPPGCMQQNPYGYSQPFDGQHPPGNRPFFRGPAPSFQTGPIPNIPGGPYPASGWSFSGNYPWQPTIPQQSTMSWRLPQPAAPPPPPPGV